MIVTASPHYEVFNNAVAQPYSRNTDSFPFRLSGCLYEESGKKIELSERFGGFENDHYISNNPSKITLDSIRKSEKLSGRSVYLGHLMYPYGHFLVETLSSFWYLLQDGQFDHYVFHPFVETGEMPAYMTLCFKLFGLDVDKVYVIDDPVVFETIIVPERLIRLNHSANSAVMTVYRHIADKVLENAGEHTGRPGQKIYLSRRRNSRKKMSRSVVNEAFLETLFLKNGFRVVYPEACGFKAQIRTLRHAEVVAGLSGTALHNCVYMRPSATLIEIGDARSRNASHPMQRICCELTGVAHIFVPFRGIVLNHRHHIAAIDGKNVFARLVGDDFMQKASVFSFDTVKNILATLEISSLVFLRLLKAHAVSWGKPRPGFWDLF